MWLWLALKEPRGSVYLITIHQGIIKVSAICLIVNEALIRLVAGLQLRKMSEFLNCGVRGNLEAGDREALHTHWVCSSWGRFPFCAAPGAGTGCAWLPECGADTWPPPELSGKLKVPSVQGLS